jgi:hypothetical protein
MSRLPVLAVSAVLLAGSTSVVAMAANRADDPAGVRIVDDNPAVHEINHAVPAPMLAPASAPAAPAVVPPARKATAVRTEHVRRVETVGRAKTTPSSRAGHTPTRLAGPAEPADDRGSHAEPGDDGGSHGGHDDGGSHS